MSSVDNVTYMMAPICLKVCSSAPPVILTRTLQHHREAGLSDAQMRRLLRLAQKYQDDYMRVAVAFVNAGAELDIIEARPNMPRKRRLVAHRARLFSQHEELLLRAYEQTARILSPAQIRTIVQIHEAQRHSVIKGLLPSLRRALGPSLTVAAARRRRRSGPK